MLVSAIVSINRPCFYFHAVYNIFSVRVDNLSKEQYLDNVWVYRRGQFTPISCCVVLVSLQSNWSMHFDEFWVILRCSWTFFKPAWVCGFSPGNYEGKSFQAGKNIKLIWFRRFSFIVFTSQISFYFGLVILGFCHSFRCNKSLYSPWRIHIV